MPVVQEIAQADRPGASCNSVWSCHKSALFHYDTDIRKANERKMQISAADLLDYRLEPCQQVTHILKALHPLSMAVASLGPDKRLWIANMAGLVLQIH